MSSLARRQPPASSPLETVVRWIVAAGIVAGGGVHLARQDSGRGTR